MRVIFLENIKGVAQIGDIKSVADGYARNFLLPRKLAQIATAAAAKQAEALKKKRVEVDIKNKEETLALAGRLESLALGSPNGVVLEIVADANEEGHLYGSVNEKMIAESARAKGINLKPEQINLLQHLKTVGEHEVELELHPEVKIKIKILVSSQSEK